MQRLNYKMSKDRLEMFSDGVFAIAITLLVLEIKIPKHEELLHAGGLYNYLLHLWPSYLAYVISFFVIGIYWSNHHWMFTFIKKTNHVFNVINIFFLMSVAFMPFTTAIFGDFVNDREYTNAAVTIFCVGFIIPPPLVLIMTLYAGHKHRLVDPHLRTSFLNGLAYKLIASTTLVGIPLALSFHYPVASVCIIGSTLLMFLIPPTPPAYDNDDAEQIDE